MALRRLNRNGTAEVKAQKKTKYDTARTHSIVLLSVSCRKKQDDREVLLGVSAGCNTSREGRPRDKNSHVEEFIRTDGLEKQNNQIAQTTNNCFDSTSGPRCELPWPRCASIFIAYSAENAAVKKVAFLCKVRPLPSRCWQQAAFSLNMNRAPTQVH
jgi:hypothetical protein